MDDEQELRELAQTAFRKFDELAQTEYQKWLRKGGTMDEIKKVRLTVDINVHDTEALIAYARERVQETWPGSTLEDIAGGQTLPAVALYEALIASSPGPLPDGIEIASYRVEEVYQSR